jgi:ribonucleoside-diphosphate reductase alpha chain
MRHAKSGNWFEVTPWRAMANISACYTEKPGMDVFMREWVALYESKSGERGIFNRQAAKLQAGKYGRRNPDQEFLCNPCSEILARNLGLCNLSEVVIRPWDDIKSLMRKVRLAAIVGTMQATLTNFRYIRSTWKSNAEEEALLGVSLTGIMDNDLTSGRSGKRELGELLEKLRIHVVDVNKEWSKKLGINPSVATTCTKPSGTVSQLVDCSSGIHPRYAKYYTRRVRCDKKDPMTKMMTDVGFPVEDDVMKPEYQCVFSFPIKAPQNTITAAEIGAIDQLEIWKVYQTHWAEHKISMTVYVGESEWMDVGAWVYKHFDIMSGVAFLPRQGGHSYKQAPYEEITPAQYDDLLAKMPKNVNWSDLSSHESDDDSVNHREYACTSSGSCEIVDLVK